MGFKSALIHISILIMDQMIMYDVEVVAHRTKPTKSSLSPTFSSLFGCSFNVLQLLSTLLPSATGTF